MQKTAVIGTQNEEPMTLNRGVPEESAAQVRPVIAVVEVLIAEIRVEGRRRELRGARGTPRREHRRHRFGDGDSFPYRRRQRAGDETPPGRLSVSPRRRALNLTENRSND